MRRITTFIIALCAAVAALAQTPMEIVSRMEEEMKKHGDEGEALVIDAKVPIMGTMTSKTYTRGDKMRVEMELMGVAMVTWTDTKTQWTYNSKTDEVEIKPFSLESDSGSEGDISMFEGITDGYEVIIKEETADAWYLVCRKLKSNTDKDAPKTMDLVVSKAYHPVSLTAKVSGVTVTLRDLTYGVPESLVTFNPADYPTAKIIDKRK
ncbi:MAG: hypothetical protein J5640_08540 [Bacteroidales bacterium]|nr:hypothetical protein [Bacteroidales bacterium]